MRAEQGAEGRRQPDPTAEAIDSTEIVAPPAARGNGVEVAFSAGRDKTHTRGLTVVRMPFDDFAQHVLTVAATLAAKDGPCVCGPLQDGRRLTEAALPIAFAALDLDAVPDEIAMRAIVEAADVWRGFGYTTSSHKPEAGIFKMRMIFALDREVVRDEYARLCRGIAARLQALAEAPVAIDANCSKPEQALYTARKGATVWRFDGALVPVDAVLAEAPADEPAHSQPQSDGTATDWLAQLLDGDDVHGNALRVVARMVSRGMDDATIRATFAVLADKPGSGARGSLNHGCGGQNVLFEDGHAEFLSNCRLDRAGDELFRNSAGFVGAGIGRDDVVIAPTEARPLRHPPVAAR